MKPLKLLRQVAPRAYGNYVKAFALNENLFDEFEIVGPLRVSHFLAQVLHETDGGTILFENMNYTTEGRLLEIFGVGNHSAAVRKSEVAGLLRNPPALAERVYGLGNPPKARELGNTDPGDGYRFRGGGLMQTTGGAAYKRLGDQAGIDLHTNPDLISTAEYALQPAVYEWAEKGGNALADRNDVRAITRRINGGYNGIKSRVAWFEKLYAIAKSNSQPLEAWRLGTPAEDTTWLQESLNNLGFDPPLVVDGKYGPNTEKAVRWFQEAAHLRIDGVAGDVTRAAMRLRLDAIRGG